MGGGTKKEIQADKCKGYFKLGAAPQDISNRHFQRLPGEYRKEKHA